MSVSMCPWWFLSGRPPDSGQVTQIFGHSRFATHEPFAAFLFEFVEALHEWPAVLRERFATQEPLAAVLDRECPNICVTCPESGGLPERNHHGHIDTDIEV